MKGSTVTRLILPTIICIMGIILVTLSSAFIYFFGDGPRKLGQFLIVFSPTIILLISLFVAWRWQLIGGTIFIIVGLCISIIIPIFMAGLINVLAIGILFISSGILFLVNHFRKKT